MKTRCFILLVALPLAAETLPTPPKGDGQITIPTRIIPDLNPPADDPAREFLGQQTTTDKLVLTASNGFFDRPIRAAGEAAVEDAAPDSLIVPDFAVLNGLDKSGTSLRWHLWIEKPGVMYANVHLSNSPDGAPLECSIEGPPVILETRSEKDPLKSQTTLSFQVHSPGWNTFTIRLGELAGKTVGDLHRVELFGPAAEDASVLRTRWRPAACHARFSSSKVADPELWVMSTRPSPDAGVTSYSPVTTPFGYFGCSFGADGVSSGSANFSLWSYGKGKPTPQERWSHMLASGSPEAIFGSFGHEGSGVKLRGDWKPFAGQKEVTLALRREIAVPWAHWFGYYLDDETQRFRLFAAGASWVGESKKIRSLNPGAFVEQPGPPDRERSGDLVRDVLRRGWMLDSKRQWHPIDTMSSGKEGLSESKHWRVTKDGWFSMGMGGMARRPGSGRPIHLDSDDLPSWLNAQAIDDLYRLPVTIGPRSISDIRATSAKLHVSINGDLAPGEVAKVTAFVGPSDCLTFDRELGYREVKARFWPQSAASQALVEGDNVMEIKGLASGETHFLRLLVETPRGSVWSMESDQFETTP